MFRRLGLHFQVGTRTYCTFLQRLPMSKALGSSAIGFLRRRLMGVQSPWLSRYELLKGLMLKPVLLVCV